MKLFSTMFTRGNFKINTAIIILLVFVFRLLFVNATLFLSLTSHKSKSAHHYSNLLKKRRKCVDNDAASGVTNYSALEACEEDLEGEEDVVKANSSVLLFFLTPVLKGITAVSGSGKFFDSSHYNLHLKRYLALSILRI
ncbi:MAG: hypothetical protein H0W61_10870 [Bacteroidetes bacterium]|nr:hypothetical protein [Bacteroidota bacterium]